MSLLGVNYMDATNVDIAHKTDKPLGTDTNINTQDCQIDNENNSDVKPEMAKIFYPL